MSWSEFQANGTPSDHPTYFPVNAEAPSVIRLDARQGRTVPVHLLGLRDVFIMENAIESSFAGAWLRELLREVGDQNVKYWQQRTYFEGFATLNSILKRMYFGSNHRTAVMMMDENILRRTTVFDDLQEELPNFLRQDDLFNLWPECLRPAQECLIMGGAGGCSTLHTDMLGWTGWNALLLGTKQWKFFPPAPEVGGALLAEVREMGGHHHLGFSCTSPVDMFYAVDGEKCPKRGPLCDGASFRPDEDRYPSAAKVEPLLEVVQRPGEIIIFPAHYFHQTYHFGATVAVASQMMNEGCKDRVLGQIMDFTSVRRIFSEDFWRLATMQQLRLVLAAVLDRQWPGNGSAYLDRLMAAEDKGQGPRRRQCVRRLTRGPETSIERVALQLACGTLDISPWEDGTSVAWAVPLSKVFW